MPTFAFSGRTRSGETVTGERVGDTIDAVVAMLRREQVLVTKVVSGQGARPTPRRRRAKLGKSASPKSLAIFTRQFSVMIDAGLPLVQCLEILGSQDPDANFARDDPAGPRRRRERRSRWPTRCGSTRRRSTRLFTQHGGARARQAASSTPILKRLATYIEKAVKLQSQVKSAMIYPVAVIVIAGVVVGGDPLEGHSDLRRDVRVARRGASAADAHRHRAERSARAVRLDRASWRWCLLGWAFKSYYATDERAVA